MPDAKMIREVGDIARACAIYTANYYFAARNQIFVGVPAARMKRD